MATWIKRTTSWYTGDGVEIKGRGIDSGDFQFIVTELPIKGKIVSLTGHGRVELNYLNLRALIQNLEELYKQVK